MEPWVIVTIVIVTAILLAVAAGWVHRITIKTPDHELGVETPKAGQFTSYRNWLRKVKMKIRGGTVDMRDTDADNSRFDIK